ncbi:MAG: Thiamin biosynthesis lipoprotein ApbE [uncultured Sulfurovum sp.]|uniref:FAD:protein FMN transferase n=1 Tax=uncultured Sulfurovum sp. TaxID=269237 RepID=A0A6S6SE20_9BACT|nr:MAG: Thiamin biosynthesis lipoprotein ApbE [uncultured Sulfurovum sp.]
MKQILLILLLINLLLEAKNTQRQQVIMGTFGTITVKNKQKHTISEGFKLLKEIEGSLSSYNHNALLYQLNKTKTIIADKYLLESIHQSQQFYKQSNGYFNIAIGSVTKKLYGFGANEKVPTSKELNEANSDINNIYIKDNHIKLSQKTTLDLGGMGKGFAVDKVANYYREQNISYAIVALSGDIQALHPTSIYLNSPFKKTSFAQLKTLHPNTSISTSGTYRRYVKSKEHHHLINPKSKRQGKSFVSITLITQQNNTLIDAMATAIGVMPEKEALKFLVNNPHIGYVLVRPNGNILYGNLEKLCNITWLFI